ncbi:unnamed protein product [Mycena citricolor]|uniref:Uncharacterized protein n=1 Tax=Mycena citricolor TaxID=2018698 RepID=A0AAD2H2J2_9AGAR|nr:unnamed protein product [Mycena citricolor]
MLLRCALRFVLASSAAVYATAQTAFATIDDKIQADPTKAFNGTWHDDSQFPQAPPISFTLVFNGTGIDVFFILANTVPFPNTITNTNLIFTLDGLPSGTFSHSPSLSTDFQYNVSVYSVSGLPQATHQLVVASNNQTAGSLMLFDYARYTYDVDASAAPNSSQQTASAKSKPRQSSAIAAGISVPLLVLAVGGGCVYSYLARKRRSGGSPAWSSRLGRSRDEVGNTTVTDEESMIQGHGSAPLSLPGGMSDEIRQQHQQDGSDTISIPPPAYEGHEAANRERLDSPGAVGRAYEPRRQLPRIPS